MKKLIYTIAFVVMGITASYAQHPGKSGKPEGTPEQRAEKHATELQTKLGLTADQKAKVQAVELERIKKGEEWHKKDEADRKGTMDERRAFMKASKDKMDAILTAEQKTKLEAERKEMMGKRGEKGGKGPRGPRGERGDKDAKTPPPAQGNN
jgi:protein CpxP